MTTKKQISDWFENGKKEGASYMIVVCDTYDYDEYPFYVYPSESVNECISYCNRSPMQQIMEVYDLNMEKNKQLSEYRSFNSPK